jgi:hypothetical protein
MTNAEAIETLENLKNLLVNKTNIEAVDFSIAALREKAEKERRYVVNQLMTYFEVYDTKESEPVADHIPTREAAQAIADIYEGVKYE